MSDDFERHFDIRNESFHQDQIEGMDCPPYYDPSGVTPLLGGNLMLLGGLLAAPICGWISAVVLIVSVVICFVSFFYCFMLMFSAAWIVGAIMGWTIARVRQWTHVRHHGFSKFVACVPRFLSILHAMC